MRDYQTADIRNFTIVGHGGCGKTILSEAILVNGGIINRIGSVEAGNTVSDYHHCSTIESRYTNSLTRKEFRDHISNLNSLTSENDKVELKRK